MSGFPPNDHRQFHQMHSRIHRSFTCGAAASWVLSHAHLGGRQLEAAAVWTPCRSVPTHAQKPGVRRCVDGAVHAIPPCAPAVMWEEMARLTLTSCDAVACSYGMYELYVFMRRGFPGRTGGFGCLMGLAGKPGCSSTDLPDAVQKGHGQPAPHQQPRIARPTPSRQEYLRVIPRCG